MDTSQLYRKHLAWCLSVHVTGYHLIMANAWISCYICCMEIDNQSFWLEFLFLLVSSSMPICVSNHVHISCICDLDNLPVLLQTRAVFSSWTLTHMRGIRQIGVDLYNKLLGNTYVKSLPQLRCSWFYFYFNMYIFGS